MSTMTTVLAQTEKFVYSKTFSRSTIASESCWRVSVEVTFKLFAKIGELRQELQQKAVQYSKSKKKKKLKFQKLFPQTLLIVE